MKLDANDPSQNPVGYWWYKKGTFFYNDDKGGVSRLDNLGEEKYDGETDDHEDLDGCEYTIVNTADYDIDGTTWEDKYESQAEHSYHCAYPDPEHDEKLKEEWKENETELTYDEWLKNHRDDYIGQVAKDLYKQTLW